MKSVDSQGGHRRPSTDDLTELWRRTIDPRSIGMIESIAADIASHTSEPIPQVIQRMTTGTKDFKDHWNASKIDVGDEGQVEAFYRDQFVEAYELANWHAGGATGSVPLNYAHAAWMARELGLRRVLDFGSGIGTGSLCFATVGCEIHSADIARQLLGLVGHRLRSRGFEPHLIDLTTEHRPQAAYYDLITCLDVLEHVPDQAAKLAELSSYLRPGGYLMVNLMDDSTDEDRPMHVSSVSDWLAFVRRTELVPEWTWFHNRAQVLVKAPFGRLRNIAGAVVDRLQGSTGQTLFERGRTQRTQTPTH